MSVVITEHKCITCKYFDFGNNECVERIICLNLLKEYDVVAECDDYWEVDE